MAIAGCAGSEWLDRANQVALRLSAGDKSASISNELLADIQEVFESKRTSKISTADLINTLIEDTEKSWATYNRGKPLSPKQLANKLRDYDIYSKSIWLGYGKTPKGYELKQFEDAFDRYLSCPPRICRHTAMNRPKPVTMLIFTLRIEKTWRMMRVKRKCWNPRQYWNMATLRIEHPQLRR